MHWHVIAPAIPERANYRVLEPEGLGTALCEGLSSYIARLADAYHVRPITFINIGLHSPSGEVHVKKKRAYIFRSSDQKSFYRIDYHCISIVKDICAAIGRKDLLKLTIHPWSKIFGDAQLLKDQRVWCPDCFNEQRKMGKPVSEPLIWSIKDSEACYKHERIYENECPKCGSNNLNININNLPGVCPKCGAWLGELGFYKKQKGLSTNTSILARKSRVIGELLARSRLVQKDQLKRLKLLLTRSVIACIQQLCNDDRKRFTDETNVTLGNWHWNYLPSLGDIASICSRYNLDVIAFLYEGTLKKADYLVNNVSDKRLDDIGRPRKTCRPVILRNEVSRLLERKLIRSATEIYRKSHTTKFQIPYHERCRSIRYVLSTSEMKELRKTLFRGMHVPVHEPGIRAEIAVYSVLRNAGITYHGIWPYLLNTTNSRYCFLPEDYLNLDGIDDNHRNKTG